MTSGNDNDLQRYLDGDHPVSDAYRRLSAAAAPDHLDDAILSAAREEARRKVRPAWLVPLSVAATVVLGVGLSMRLIYVPSTALSDMTAARPSLEAASSPAVQTDARQRSGRDAERVPKPNVEELLRTEPLEAARLEGPSVDVESLREKALTNTRTVQPPPLDALVLPAPASAPAAGADETAVFAPPPPAARREDDASHPGEDVALYSKKELPLADDAVRQGYLGLNGDEMERAPARSSTAMSLDVEQLDALIEQQLDLIQKLHRDGKVDQAQRLFDELIETFPDYEIPADFPLQPPTPDTPDTPAP